MKKRGIVAGAFDLIHPGYISLFKNSKIYCEYLIVALHKDPSIQRKSKMKPILDVDDRKSILESIRYIDEVIIYETEEQLNDIIRNANISVRFLGDDYINQPYTGKYENIELFYINRDHGWSTTKLKKLISESYAEFQRNGCP